MTIRTLFLAVKLPFPTRCGGDLRVWQHVGAACGAGPVAVFGLRSEAPSRPPHRNIERWITSSDPTLTLAPEGPERLAWLADPDASPADRYLSPTSADEVRRLIDDFRPDVVVVEEIFLHRYIRLLGELPLVLDTFNVEAVVHARLAEVAASPHLTLIMRRFAERVAAFEAASLRCATRIWVCSEGDKRQVEERYGPWAPVTVVPSGVDVDRYPRATGGPYDLVFPASFAWLPNERAALFLLEEVLPLLPPAARLTLCGTNVPRSVLDAATDPRVEVTGAVPDVKPFLARAGCMPIPLGEGGGTRLKAVEAFATRLPVVSTAKGIEGIGASAGVHYLLAEDAAGFVEAVARLERDPECASRLRRHAYDLVRQLYSWEVTRRIIRTELEAAAAGLRA